MFPNVRLMIVAVFASIMGISCALSLFAEFRVSHDSFLRESNVSAPLQLGSNGATPATVVNAAAPFEFRFQANPLSSAGTEGAGATITPEHAAGVEAPHATPVVVSAPEPATSAAPSVSALGTAPVAGPAPEPATPPTPSDHAREIPNPAAIGSVAGQDGHGAKPDGGGDPAARTPAASLPIQGAMPESIIAPGGATASEAGKHAGRTSRRRTVVVRRIQRSRSVAPAQDFAAAQPAYQWSLQSGLQSPQTVRRRVVIKRIRPARKPVAKITTPRATAASNSTVGSNTQR